MNDSQAALEAYEKAIQSDPYYALAYLNKANVLCHLQQYQQAEITYRQAIVQDPKNFEAFYRLGLLLFEQNRFAEALESLRQRFF